MRQTTTLKDSAIAIDRRVTVIKVLSMAQYF
jgi:hypothetical protein